VWKEAMDNVGVFPTSWIRRFVGSGVGAKLCQCGIADDAFKRRVAG